MARQRTLTQNKSFHKFCKLLADELNARGITQGEFARCFEVDNTQDSVKDVLREAGFKKYLENSTTKWSTIEMQEIYEEAMRMISMHPEWKVKHIDWPSEESLAIKEGKIKY